VKVLTLQPQMNRFIQNKKLYQRDDLSIAFVVKKHIGDVADDGLIFLKFDKTANVEIVGEKILQEIEKAKVEKPDIGDKSVKTLSKLPRFVLGFMARIMNFLDVKGLLPRSVADTDMNYASVFISNLGSTKLNSGYHHLTNRGTNSVFVVIGEEKLQAVYDDIGQVEMRKIIPLGITIDERIADELYFSRSINLLKHLLQHPEELEKPAEVGIYPKNLND
ncbi:MAG: 2-oxo acid dehydrogenase subunit E2, partial [Clostridia bacterium]